MVGVVATSLLMGTFKKQLSLVKTLEMTPILVTVQEEKEMTSLSKTEQGRLVAPHVPLPDVLLPTVTFN